MNPVEVEYQRLLKEKDEARRRAFMDAPDEFPVAASGEAPASKPSAGEAPSKNPFKVLGKGLGAAGETAMTGFTHFVNGLNSSAKAKGIAEQASGFGEQALGALTILMALPMGVGATIKGALEAYTPGIDKAIALGPQTAGFLRTFMGVPSLLLDPKMRRLLFDPIEGLSDEELTQVQELKDGLFKLMTYGEVAENVAIIAAAGKGEALAKSFLRKGLAKGPQVLRPEEPPPSAPLRVKEATRPTGPVKEQFWEEPWSPPEYPDKPTMSPENMVVRLQQIAGEAGGGTVGKEAPGGATASQQPPKGEPQTAATPFGELKSAIEIATAKAEEIIAEEIAGPAPVEATTTKAGVQIVSRTKVAEGKTPPETPKAEAPKVGPTFKIGRGKHGQVDVQYPDQAHADLYAAPGRSRRKMMNAPGTKDPRWHELAQEFGVEPKELVGMAYEYRKAVNDAVRGLEEGEVYKAPKFEEQTPAAEGTPKKGKYKTQKDKTVEGLTGERGSVDLEKLETALAKLPELKIGEVLGSGWLDRKGKFRFAEDPYNEGMAAHADLANEIGYHKTATSFVEDSGLVRFIHDGSTLHAEVGKNLTTEQIRAIVATVRKQRSDLVIDSPIGSKEFARPTVDEITNWLAGIKESPTSGKLTGEAGATDLGLLARMAVGAAVGATQGDTLEERLAYMLSFGLGAGLAPRVAKRVARTFASDPAIRPLLDKSNPQMPGMSPPVDPAKITTKVVKDIWDQIGEPVIKRILTADETTKLPIEDLRLGKQAEMKVWEQADKVADDLIAGRPVEPGELKNTLALGVTLHNAITHSGRRLGATGRQGMARVKIAIDQINKLAREYDPQMPEVLLAHALKTTGSIEKVGAFTRMNYAIPEAITQAGMGAMLFGKAVVKNGIGNGAMMPISLVDRSIAALKFWDPNRVTFSEVNQMHIAMWEGIADQFRIIRYGKTAWSELAVQAEKYGATHQEIAPQGFQAIADITSMKAFEYLGTAADFGPGILSRTDGMAKAINGRMGATFEGMRQAQAEGLSGQAYWDRVAAIKNDYSLLTEDALVRVKDFHDHQTFTKQIESGFVRAFQIGPENPWANMVYRLGLLPFVRTPIRLLEVGAEYTPGLNLVARNFYDSLSKGGVERDVALARLATGSAVMGSFYWLAQQGYVTGNLPQYPESTTMEHGGRPPQSFWDPLAEKYRSYKGIEPLTQWISTGADMAYLIGQMDEVTAERFMTAASVAVSQNINATQFLQSVGEFVDMVKAGRADVSYEKSMDFVRRRLGVFMPAAVRELAGGEEQKKVMKPSDYEQKGVVDMAHQELRLLIDEYMKNLGMTGEPGERPFTKVKRNMFTGDPLRNDTWPFNPFTQKSGNFAPWAREIQRLDGAGLEPLPEFIGKRIPTDLGLKDKPTTPGVRLSRTELDQWERIMTKEIVDQHGRLTASLDALVQSKFYKEQSEVGKREAIQARWLEFKMRAEEKLLERNPELARTVLEKYATHSIGRMPTAQQPAVKESLELILKSGRGRAPSPGAAP